jgi:hypothetical protein
MKYVRIIDKQITYPFNPNILRNENPGISFPREMSDKLLAEFNVFPVKEQPQLEPSVLQKVIEIEPIFIDNEWLQNWELVSADVPEEVSAAQMRLFLHSIDLLKDVEDKIATMSKEVQLAWEYEIRVRRNSPLLNEVAKTFNLTSEQIDEFFILASKL